MIRSDVHHVDEERGAGRAYGGTQSVQRALRILKLFHGRPRWTASEVGAQAGLNRSTAFRILTALEAEGMVERVPDGDAFRLGPQIAALGRLTEGAGDLQALAQRELGRLAAELNETATLEVLDGKRVRIVAEAMGDRVLCALPSIGTTWPLHATSTGKVLLAERTEGERAVLLAGRLMASTEKTILSKRALAAEIARIRRRGYSVSSEELEMGYVAVGVAVRNARGRAIAALSIGGPKQRMGRGRIPAIGKTLRAAAEALTGELGGAQA